MRAEDEWYWPEVTLTTGSASVLPSDEGPPEASEFAGMLLVPDVEQRRGWREFYVKRAQPKPGARQIGFHR